MGHLLRIGTTTVDLARGEAVRDGRAVRLTLLELELLGYLWERAGQPVSREELLRRVWRHRADTMTRAVDQAIWRLRRKLEPQGPVHLRPVYGEGYVLADVQPVSFEAGEGRSSPFVGRAAAFERLRALAVPGALVTVVGPAGAGKSRLAWEYALQQQPASLWWVDCQAATDADALASHVARALGLATPALEALVAFLAERERTLLVLDDADRAAGAAVQIERWQEAVPHLQVLATGRSPLRAGREQLVAIEGLEGPEAMELLLERSARAGVALDRTDPALDRLLGQLDRLPLAIELAAARLRATGPSALAEQLGAGGQVLPALQRAIASSWDRLAPDEREALVRLTVLQGPFEAGAAGALGLAEERLVSLHQRSLLRRHEDGRYGQYESVRSFARERAAPGVLADAEARHAAHHVAAGLALLRAHDRGEEALEEGRALSNELRAAWAFSRTRDPVLAGQAAQVLGWLALAHGPLHDLDEMLTEALLPPLPEALRHALLVLRGAARNLARSPALARDDLLPAVEAADTAVRCEARLQLACAVANLREPERAQAMLAQAIEEAEAAGLSGHLSRLLVERGLFAMERGDLDGLRQDLERAAEVARAGGQPRDEGYACRVLAMNAWRQARMDEARRWLERAIPGASDLDLALLVGNLGLVMLSLGRFAEALDLMRRHLRLFEALGQALVVPLSNLGEVHVVMGQLDEAERLFVRALGYARQGGPPGRVGDLLAALGHVAHARGELPRARELFGQAQESYGDGHNWELAVFRADLAWQEGDLAAAAADYELALQELEGSGQALGRDGVLARLACVRWAAGEPARARALLAGLRGERVPGEERLVRIAEALLSGDRQALQAVLLLHESDPLPVRLVAARLQEIDRYPGQDATSPL